VLAHPMNCPPLLPISLIRISRKGAHDGHHARSDHLMALSAPGLTSRT